MVSVLCAVCGSYGGLVVRRSLLSNSLGASTPRRLLTLRDVLLAPRALHVVPVFLGKFWVPGLVHVAPGAHFLPVLPSCCSSAA